MNRLLTYVVAIAFIVLFVFIVLPAQAAGLDVNAAHAAGFDRLTESEKAAILQQIAEKSAAKPSILSASPSPSPEKIDQWMNIGERVGKMIGGAAKEVGVAVNDFVKTPVGMTAMALIVWHYMGGMVVHVFGGLLVLVVGLTLVTYFVRRYRGETIEYDTDKKDMFGRSVIKVIHRRPVGGEEVALFMFASSLVLVLAIATAFTY